MESNITSKPETAQVEISVTVSAEELEPFLKDAAKELSKKQTIKGFRPGKVPLNVAVDVFGQERVVNTALEKAVPRFFMDAVMEHKVEVLGRPATTVKKAGIKEGIEFEATADVLPEVKLGDISAISVEKKAVEVTDKQLEHELTHLAKSRSTYIDIARPAQDGDTVITDFTVSQNGETIEGGESKQHPVHLGEGHFVPDFEKNLLGISAGDTREFEISFPDDFPQESFRGQKAQAVVKAHEVKKRVIPEINDEFAKGLGQFADAADLKAKLKENMQAEVEQREHDRLRGEVTEKLAETATFSALPESLIEREVDRRVGELAQMLAMQQKTVEKFLEDQKTDLVKIREEMREPAERTVRVSLAMRQFAQDNDIQVSDEEVDAQLTQLKAELSEEQLKELDEDEAKFQVASTLRNQKALEALLGMVTVKEVADTKQAEAAPEKG